MRSKRSGVPVCLQQQLAQCEFGQCGVKRGPQVREEDCGRRVSSTSMLQEATHRHRGERRATAPCCPSPTLQDRAGTATARIALAKSLPLTAAQSTPLALMKVDEAPVPFGAEAIRPLRKAPCTPDSKAKSTIRPKSRKNRGSRSGRLQVAAHQARQQKA
jgi:hypothetical protein